MEWGGGAGWWSERERGMPSGDAGDIMGGKEFWFGRESCSDVEEVGCIRDCSDAGEVSVTKSATAEGEDETVEDEFESGIGGLSATIGWGRGGHMVWNDTPIYVNHKVWEEDNKGTQRLWVLDSWVLGCIIWRKETCIKK